MVLIRKKMLVVLLALLGTILLVVGINFFSVKASASSFMNTVTPPTSVVVGVTEKDNYFKYPNVEDIKPEQGKYENSDTHNKYVINEIYFGLTDPELTKCDYILVPKDCYLSWDYTWIGTGFGAFPVSVRDQIHMIDLSDYGISGAKLQIKQRLKEDDHFQVSDDTWDKGIDGIPNSNIRIGRGVLFFRTDTYDIARNKTEGKYSKVTNLADIGYNNISSPFVNIKEECDVTAVICYEVYNHGWWWWDNAHYNIRYDYEIKYRNNTSDLVTKDTNTKSELSNNHSLDGKAGKTTNGFYIDTAGNH